MFLQQLSDVSFPAATSHLATTSFAEASFGAARAVAASALVANMPSWISRLFAPIWARHGLAFETLGT
jgi:hypothetical protein